jgi:acylphosphatase
LQSTSSHPVVCANCTCDTRHRAAPDQDDKIGPAPTIWTKHLAWVESSLAQAAAFRSDLRMISLQIFFEGNVQGVGFRWSVKQVAKGFDVVGWVRNLPDGRVELQASGEETEVRAFIAAIGQSELRAHIRKQTELILPEPFVARGFEIRHD